MSDKKPRHTPVRPFRCPELAPAGDRGPPPGGDGPGVRPFRPVDLDEAGVLPFPAAPGAGGKAPAGPPLEETRIGDALERARRESQRIVAEARAEAEAIREQARREGIEAGTAEGRARTAEAADRVAVLAEELARFKPALYEEARSQVVELALAVVGKLLGPLAEGDRQAVVRVVERALQVVSDRESLTVRVHPDDLKSLLDAKPTLQETVDGIQKLTLIEDPAVRPGGCLVQSPSAEIDARLDSQLEALARTLRNL
ncbi:MAG: hypothetical protein Kow0092_00040 [Deferrisomatales bacterium]